MKFAKPLKASTRAKVALPFAIVTLLWGSTWLVIRNQLGEVPVTWSVCYRFATASAVMFVIALVTRAPLRLSARDQLLLAVMGIPIFCINFNLSTGRRPMSPPGWWRSSLPCCSSTMRCWGGSSCASLYRVPS